MRCDMTYNILALADLHWGCIRPDDEEDQLEFVFTFLDKWDEKLDLIVIAGDYFDSKLSLNSKEALIAVKWFNRLYDYCKENSVVLRLLQGTMDHDNDQLEVFRSLENEWFKIIRKTMVEETLPNFVCCYCPDELIQTDEYELQYTEEIMKLKDMGFFHGSFDSTFGKLLETKPEIMNTKNVIFRYDKWSNRIKGPMIAGHWHDGHRYKEMYYVGTPFQSSFADENTKGFLFIQYDTDDSSYLIHKIENPLSPKYYTYEFFTNTCKSEEEYVFHVNTIKDLLAEMDKTLTKDRLRITVNITDEKQENDVFISALRSELTNHRNCKLTIKNKIKEEKNKKDKTKTLEEDKEKNKFIFDANTPIAEKIRKFINQLSDQEVDIPIDFIQDRIDRYSKLLVDSDRKEIDEES